jgi:hypothetical protein
VLLATVAAAGRVRLEMTFGSGGVAPLLIAVRTEG